MALDAGRLAVAVRIAGAKGGIAPETVSLRIERLGTEEREVTWGNKAASQFDLAAGRYRVESRIGLANVRAEREFELKPGARDQLVLEHQAGGVRMKLLDATGAAPVPDVAWEVRDAATATELGPAPRPRHRPCCWQGATGCEPETRDRQVERLIDVRSGETRTFEITGK